MVRPCVTMTMLSNLARLELSVKRNNLCRNRPVRPNTSAPDSPFSGGGNGGGGGGVGGVGGGGGGGGGNSGAGGKIVVVKAASCLIPTTSIPNLPNRYQKRPNSFRVAISFFICAGFWKLPNSCSRRCVHSAIYSGVVGWRAGGSVAGRWAGGSSVLVGLVGPSR